MPTFTIYSRYGQADGSGPKVIVAGEAETLRALVEAHHAAGCHFTDANLHRANLRGLTLTGGNFNGADLRGANLQDANLHGTSFSNADLRDVHLMDAVLTSALLDEADLRGTNLRGTNLEGTTCSDANFRGANLHQVRLVGASLDRANLVNADLNEADLSYASLDGALIDEAELHETKLVETIMPTGESWEVYCDEVVPALLRAGGRSLSAVLATDCWTCHDWENCPMAEAFQVTSIAHVPVLYRPRVAQFTQFFDADLLVGLDDELRVKAKSLVD